MSNRYVVNNGLFAESYFRKVLDDPGFPVPRRLPGDAQRRFGAMLDLWESIRTTFIADQGHLSVARYAGLPDGYAPLVNRAESAVENGWIHPVVQDVLGYAFEQNRTLRLKGDAAANAETKRPDSILFSSKAAHRAVVELYGTGNAAAPDGADFCREADFILDAKKFHKGVGIADPGEETPQSKRHRTETGVQEDMLQVEGYLRGCDKEWGVLTNGRSWILIQKGRTEPHLRFELVLLLEDARKARGADGAFAQEHLDAFNLFWHLFGIPAVAGGYLDALRRESEASNRTVRETLRENAHQAVQEIARGFWRNPSNRPQIPERPTQEQLDHLRELSLTFLYRLLFVLKAEAQNLLPVRDERGADTDYRKTASTEAIFGNLKKLGISTRSKYGNTFRRELRDLFNAINEGNPALGVPAYNGGLFDPVQHAELEKLELLDESLFQVLSKLIYLDAEAGQALPVPYADLDVRDLGDIYEGLLEQRLALAERDGKPVLELRNQKGERKASGSYFTPDSIVEHLVRKAVEPLLEAAGDDAERILSLNVLDPAMGSGHFLVKAVDVIASYLTVHCDPVDADAPRDTGPKELAYWKGKVVERCIYGVDYNPMAVELAKVALWLHTARRDKPLSFLDHHLKVGNSLVGARLEDLASPGLQLKRTKRKGAESLKWAPRADLRRPAEGEPPPPKKKRKKGDAAAQAMLFPLDTSLFSGVLESIGTILDRPSDAPGDIRQKREQYATLVNRRLEAHKLLADLWCAQWFMAEPDGPLAAAYRSDMAERCLYEAVREICGFSNDAQRREKLDALLQAAHPLVERVKKARDEGYGPRPLAFFHWQLEFPEVAFGDDGKPRPGFGFDAVVGNPPWDKIKPAKRDFYRPISPEVANSQGASLNALITRLESENPELAEEWAAYEKAQKGFAAYLADCGEYRHQSCKVNGKKTGGDPDLFRYFVERAFHALGQGGRVGFVVPGGIWQAEGCTALRRMLFRGMTLESLFVFENYRQWAFDIDSRSKFTSFVAKAVKPPKSHAFPVGFMLRDTSVLDGQAPERVVNLSAAMAEAMSPDTLALLDFRSDADAQLCARLHKAHPALGCPESGWNVTHRRELDMDKNAYLFKSAGWMKSRGFTLVRPVPDEAGHWTQEKFHRPRCVSLPENLPPGGEYWVSADEEYYRDRPYEERTFDIGGEPTLCFISKEDLEAVRVPGSRYTEGHFRILPGSIYTALYEGRMVHNFDHANKGYVSGEGRQAIWRNLNDKEKILAPRVFVSIQDTHIAAKPKVGFCEISGATNERTTLATILPSCSAAGNKVPTLTTLPGNSLALSGLLNSFVWDYLIRLRVSTTLNWVYVRSTPLPKVESISEDHHELQRLAAKLSCTTPELADYWNAVYPGEEWTYESAERDPWKRAELRAEIDAIVADLYGLSVAEYACVLTGFPLLDRDHPSLCGDYFLTETDESFAKKHPDGKGKKWDEADGAYFELKPRSFITRDFALLAYMRRKGHPIPEDLEKFYREEVGLDPNGPLSRFRIGEVKDLEDRVIRARDKGAVPYIPTQRGSKDSKATSS